MGNLRDPKPLALLSKNELFSTIYVRNPGIPAETPENHRYYRFLAFADTAARNYWHHWHRSGTGLAPRVNTEESPVKQASLAFGKGFWHRWHRYKRMKNE